MKRTLLLAAGLCQLLLATSVWAEAANPGEQAVPRVAVLDFRASGVDENLAKTLLDVLMVEATNIEGLQVIGMEDVKAVLGYEELKSLMGCDDNSCIAELGGALGVKAILLPKVGKVGTTYVLSLRLIDARSGQVLESAMETVEQSADPLVAATRRLARQVLRTLLVAPKSQVSTEEKSEANVVQTTVAETSSDVEPAQEGSLFYWPAAIVTGVGLSGALFGGAAIITSLVVYNNIPFLMSDNGRNGYYPASDDIVIAFVGLVEVFTYPVVGCCSLVTAGGGLWWFLHEVTE